jgi:hypothetical protein
MTERIVDREREQPVAYAERRPPPLHRSHAVRIFGGHGLSLPISPLVLAKAGTPDWIPAFAGMSGNGSLLHFARDAETNKIVLAMRVCIRALQTTTRTKKLASHEGRRSADRRTVHVRAAQTSVRELAHLICCAAAAHIASRSPFGAPPRHSPGRTHPPLAQLQFPRFLRPSSTGVTRCRLSRVYRAPRRPVIVPVERWPRAARERFARPRAGTALAPHLDRIRNAPFDERDSIRAIVAEMGTHVK